MDKRLVQQFHLWSETQSAQTLLRLEQSKIDSTIANTFGYLALQIGLPHIDYLVHNRTRKKLILSRLGTQISGQKYPCITVPDDHIPLEEQSTDLIVLPHTLELSPFPQQILKEAHRVLINEGKLLVTGFNPWHISMLGRLYRSSRLPMIPYQRLISIHRLKDWFTLYGFEIDYQASHIHYWQNEGIFYTVSASKRSAGMHLIGHALPKKVRRSMKTAVATQKHIP